MANKNIQIKDALGNHVFPKTFANIVFNDKGEGLGGVEANAQVNTIETVKVNGVALDVVSKTIDITIPEGAVYTIAKAETAEDGMSATYQLTKDGVAVGEKINIPKDMFIQSGSVETCAEEDAPVEGLKVGDKYIDIILANAEDEHIYIPVADLIVEYTPADGSGIVINAKEIGIDDTILVTHDQLNQALQAYQVSFSEEQLAVLDSGITAEKVATYDGYAELIEGKADKATTLAGYGIVDGLTYEELV